MSLLEIKNLQVSFQTEQGVLPVLRDLALSVEEHEIFVLLGRSGCGKTTLLRTIGGFLKPDDGNVLFNGQKITAPSIERMMIFQSFDQLFPWFTLRENILYALKKTKTDPSTHEEISANAIHDTGLAGFENLYPASLSGGMKQRGAIARALALHAKLLLMDEPFSSLDYANRQHLYRLLGEINKTRGTTVLLVTHDIEEALCLGDRIAVFDTEAHHIGETFPRKDCDAETLRRLLNDETAAGGLLV